MQALLSKYRVSLNDPAKTAAEVKKTTGDKAAGSKTVASTTAAPPNKKAKQRDHSETRNATDSEVLENHTSSPTVFKSKPAAASKAAPATVPTGKPAAPAKHSRAAAAIASESISKQLKHDDDSDFEQ